MNNGNSDNNNNKDNSNCNNNKYNSNSSNNSNSNYSNSNCEAAPDFSGKYNSHFISLHLATTVLSFSFCNREWKREKEREESANRLSV